MAASRRRLVVVANRGPTTFGRDDEGHRVTRRGAGGLVTALGGLLAHHDVTWIASAITPEDKVVAAESGSAATTETARDGSSYRLRLVVHDDAVYDRFYTVAANPLLWFVQHGLWGLAAAPSFDRGLHDAWHEGYVRVNEAFAEATLDELEQRPDAAVWFHDYHLYLAPALVRERAPEALLAQFVHIPWPASDLWRVLPEGPRRAVHEGLLANDVVGFHTERWAANFRRSCLDVLGVDADERTSVTARPISVDPVEFDALARSEAVLAAERELVQRRPERLIVRVDRTDPSKNVVRGFRALELYLEAHPEACGRVVMLALLDPSRQDIPEYAEYLGAIEREARRVNDRFAEGDWRPVDLRVRNDFPQSVAAYKQFDVLFVNVVSDGLNLVAKEAPLVNERDGVVVLSENAGAHAELGEWALTVSPFDVAGQAEAIHHALELPAEERRARLDGIRAQVREHDLAAWIRGQLADADEARAARYRSAP